MFAQEQRVVIRILTQLAGLWLLLSVTIITTCAKVIATLVISTLSNGNNFDVTVVIIVTIVATVIVT